MVEKLASTINIRATAKVAYYQYSRTKVDGFRQVGRRGNGVGWCCGEGRSPYGQLRDPQRRCEE